MSMEDGHGIIDGLQGVPMYSIHFSITANLFFNYENPNLQICTLKESFIE
jgi:hypothetical protein